MVYQPGQAQYPQPQPGYGQPSPGYGAPPPGQPIGMLQPDIKWSGLSTGGAFKIPVVAFIGRLTEVLKDSSSQYGLRIIEKFDQVQILESPVPWPWATVDVSIKYSERENSGWGHHVASAKAIGLAQQAATLDQAMAELVGKVFELRQGSQSYGEDDKGVAMQGDVWRFVRIVVPGQAQPFPQPQYAVPQPVVASIPSPTILPNPNAVAAPPPPPPPPPAAPIPPGPTGAFDVTLNPADTAPVRAKKLLHGRALNEWLGVALVDDKVKADPAFINSIYDQSFIVSLKASNQVAQGVDGRFAVTA